MKTQKTKGKGTIHLPNPHNSAAAVCGKAASKVVLWAKKSPPAADHTGICRRCLALQKGKTEKIEKRRQPKITKAVVDIPPEVRAHMSTTGKRQPALLILGDKMPTELHVTYKGTEHLATVGVDGSIVVVGHGQTYFSPSRAGKAVAGREVDGWTFWSYKDVEGKLHKLDALRKAVA